MAYAEVTRKLAAESKAREEAVSRAEAAEQQCSMLKLDVKSSREEVAQLRHELTTTQSKVGLDGGYRNYPNVIGRIKYLMSQNNYVIKSTRTLICNTSLFCECFNVPMYCVENYLDTCLVSVQCALV